MKELNQRLEEVEDELEDLRSEQRELEARIEELDQLLNHDLEYLCWPEISALESLLVSPTFSLIRRVRQILSNHCRLYS